jgi:hypothetical protein
VRKGPKGISIAAMDCGSGSVCGGGSDGGDVSPMAELNAGRYLSSGRGVLGRCVN